MPEQKRSEKYKGNEKQFEEENGFIEGNIKPYDNVKPTRK